MPKKNTPGCHCCQGCMIAEFWGPPDSSDPPAEFVEVSGDFSVVANAVRTADSHALLLAAASSPSSAMYTELAQFDLGANNNRVRLVIGWYDSQNYLYAEVEKTGDNGTLKLFRVNSGAHAQVGATTSLVGFSLEVTSLQLCAVAGYLYANIQWHSPVTGTTTRAFARGPASPPGDKAGFGTGTISTAISVVSFRFSRHRSESDPNCSRCRQECSVCLNDEQPTSGKFVLTGAGDGRCDSATPNGTYLLPWAASSPCILDQSFPGEAWATCNVVIDGVNHAIARPQTVNFLVHFLDISGVLHVALNLSYHYFALFGDPHDTIVFISDPVVEPLDCLHFDMDLHFLSFTPRSPGTSMFEESDWENATVHLTSF